MYQCKACHEEVTKVQVPDAVGKGQHETSQCPNCGEDCEYEEVEDLGTHFEIQMSRIGYGYTTITINSDTPISLKEAEERALDEAGDHLYNENSSEYELTNGSQATEPPPPWDINDTVGATVHLMARFEIPKAAVEVPGGFNLPNGKTYKVVISMEETDDSSMEASEPDGEYLESLGIVGFGDLDERDIQIEDEEG